MENIADMKKLRHLLHQNAEVSGKEIKTSTIIEDFLKKQNPDTLLTKQGGNAIIAIFNGMKPGFTTMIRADMDAVKVSSSVVNDYSSLNKSVSHQCGHDGHSAILAGLASFLNKNRPVNGKIVLLFQPEEETGNGAKRIISKGVLNEIAPDFIFGYHNLPGFSENTIITKEGTFASASSGLAIELKGKNAHAANPESGISPVLAVMSLIDFFEKLNKKPSGFKDFILNTITHVSIGKPVFGISPGSAKMLVTLRSFSDTDMNLIIKKISNKILELKVNHRLEIKTSLSDVFPALVNNSEALAIVEQAARKMKIKIKRQNEPFRWSEDFAHYNNIAKTCYFGIGAGKDCPGLHQESYDFPDSIIPKSIEFLGALCSGHFS
ncbi:MAG: hypothetical protein A2W91_10580 [Bacteroidetes bacterium GWF2_38_335]|nr:MAG: hypothetical protein A2W91_10580 [Bacteroidetes bacterium GWF2_38_335]OFY81850.1 MAG: hypothetical protein A2281_06460 [Bacteroidetes bacterium RIFOXYA12_FULL_38_20]HBS87927.1 amidohydrolase [Bacteroidales bacterium]